MAMDDLFRSATPAVPIRGVHLDLKGTPPTAARLVELLNVIGAARYNAVLVEWEDTFPWTVDERFSSETAYTPEQVAAFLEAAAAAEIEVIPLVQCLGHMETPLSVPDYVGLREVPHRADVLNPLAPGARELVRKMVEDVLALTPDLRHFHLGGDEAWSFGTHPDTAAFVAQHGKGALYLHHVEPILDLLNQRGIRPILWHDMMREWDGEALRRLGEKADLMAWGYGGHPGRMRDHCNTGIIARFQEHGITVWGATAYKGGDGMDVDLPNIERREENAAGWAELGGQFGLAGIVATAWSRYSTHNVQCEPIDACLDALVDVGVILHDGSPPAGGVEAAADALAEIGEKARFDACRAAMAALTEARRAGWANVARLRQHLVMAGEDGRRRGSGLSVRWLETLSKSISDAEAAAEMTRAAFAGLMESIWIERYLSERITPLKEELAVLEPRVAALEPDSYKAGFGKR